MGEYPYVAHHCSTLRFGLLRMLAKGIDPIETKHQAKTQAAIKGRTFESAALDWHKAMSAKWAPGHAKTVLNRLKTHVFQLIGARSIVDLHTHDLMQPLEAIRKRGTIDVALRVQNYLQSIMREAKRARHIPDPFCKALEWGQNWGHNSIFSSCNYRSRAQSKCFLGIAFGGITAAGTGSG